MASGELSRDWKKLKAGEQKHTSSIGLHQVIDRTDPLSEKYVGILNTLDFFVASMEAWNADPLYSQMAFYKAQVKGSSLPGRISNQIKPPFLRYVEPNIKNRFFCRTFRIILKPSAELTPLNMCVLLDNSGTLVCQTWVLT